MKKRTSKTSPAEWIISGILALAIPAGFGVYKSYQQEEARKQANAQLMHRVWISPNDRLHNPLFQQPAGAKQPDNASQQSPNPGSNARFLSRSLPGMGSVKPDDGRQAGKSGVTQMNNTLTGEPRDYVTLRSEPQKSDFQQFKEKSGKKLQEIGQGAQHWWGKHGDEVKQVVKEGAIEIGSAYLQNKLVEHGIVQPDPSSSGGFYIPGVPNPINQNQAYQTPGYQSGTPNCLPSAQSPMANPSLVGSQQRQSQAEMRASVPVPSSGSNRNVPSLRENTTTSSPTRGAGAMIWTPGKEMTTVTPTPGGGATIWTPGKEMTRVTPTPGGGKMIWTPGKEMTTVTPTPGAGVTNPTPAK